MDMLSDAILLMDPNGVVEYYNGAFQRLFESKRQTNPSGAGLREGV